MNLSLTFLMITIVFFILIHILSKIINSQTLTSKIVKGSRDTLNELIPEWDNKMIK